MGPLQGRAQALARSGGFTLVELLVVISLVAIFFGVALDRFLRYQELAERTAMEMNLAAMNVGLTLKFAALVTQGRGAAVEREVGANPIDLLARAPENYLGELYAPAPESLPRRSWYYDRRSGDLVYLPGSRTRYLAVAGQVPDSLRFRVAFAAPPAVAPRESYTWNVK